MTAPSVQTQRRGSTRPPSISDEESGTPSPKPKPRPKPKPKFKQPAQTTILHLDEPQHLPRIPQTVRRRVVKLVQDSGLSLTSEVQQVLHGVIPASCSGLYLALDTAEKRTPEKN
ncbi:hypothetical protein MKEN_00805100 [Mycena kentingensis (nom. inval.)]|nr:hypothetical protein MKEN_00805100 [Mycena kentingensis (nom. inval.)]